MEKTKDSRPIWVETLRTRMAALGLTPRRLSLHAGLNPTAVRDMLEGRARFPRYDTIQSLSKVLGLSPAQLMGDKTANQNGPETDNLDLLVEIITRLQEEVAKGGHQIAPQDFAAMTATLYRQMRGAEPQAAEPPRDLSPKIQDLLAYESLKKRAVR